MYKTTRTTLAHFKQHKHKHTKHTTHTKHTKHTKHPHSTKSTKNTKNTNPNDEKQFCNTTRQYLQRIIPHNILNSYNLYASELTDKFISNNKTILDMIFNIKDRYRNKSLGTLQYELLISKPIKLKTANTLVHPETLQYNIPPFIDIIKYLFSIDAFKQHFTIDELAGIMPVLNTYTTKHNNNANIIYDYLENNKIGYKIIDIYYEKFNNVKLYNKFPSLKIHNLLINNFTSYKLLESIEKHMNTLSICTLTLSPREHIQQQQHQQQQQQQQQHHHKQHQHKQHYNKPTTNAMPFLYIYSDSDTPHRLKTQKHLPSKKNELIISIIERVLFFNELLGGITILPNKLLIYLTNDTKQIDNNLKLGRVPHFKTVNINSAATNNSDIIIYRKQEILKSIFHELIHFHKLDSRINDTNDTNDTHINIILTYLKSTHNISENNEYLLYECITEVLANILNNIYSISSSVLETPETQDILYNNKYSKFHNNYVNELIFSIFQVAKILKLCKYVSWEEFVLLEKKPTPTTLTTYNTSSNMKHSSTHTTHTHKHTHTHTHNINKQFIQDSCVFSYYILKLYILLNIDEYFITILDTKLAFNPTLVNCNKLIKIFEKGRTNKHLARMINAILNSKKNKSHTKQNNSIYNTLRMTCII